MAFKKYELIEKKEALIEEKRLEIKKMKNEKKRLRDKMDIVGNIYEYLVIPVCAISIALVALLSGPIIYVLPSAAAAGAIGVISYKFSLRNKIDKLNNKIANLKKERQDAYDEREKAYEDIFNNLNMNGKDENNYYHQIVKASNECDELTKSMIPYKEKKKKVEKARNIIARTFDYCLAPMGAVLLPLVCSFADMGTLGEIAVMGASSAVLLGCASVDDRLTKKVEELEDNIQDIKNDRTVKYVKRDLKLNEALNHLKRKEQKNNEIQYRKTSKKVEKKEKSTMR